MKIGELATRSGTTARTIRFYEQAGLLPEPTRTPSGYRDYGTEFIDRLAFIRRAQAAGLTLREICQVLAIHDRGETRPCTHVRHVLTARLGHVRAQIAELLMLEGHLEVLLTHAQQDEPPGQAQATVCWILETEPIELPDNAERQPAVVGG